MRAKTIGFVLAALIGASAFVRLGLWQVSRLHERQRFNAVMASRLVAAPASIESLTGPPDSLRYRRARVSGAPDYAHESVLVQRSHEGSPGVYLVTPVLTPGNDTATMVVRGWVYSPDGVRVDQSRWREGDSLTVEGYLDELPAGGEADSFPGQPNAVRRLQRADLARRAGRPVRAMYLWAVSDGTAPSTQKTARFTLPVLDDGPHRSYAIQWFCFAIIALVGAAIVVRNDRREVQDARRTESTATIA